MRYKITLEYDGSRYAGWQIQKEDRTVQGELLKAAEQVFGTRDLEFYGAGRTDAGVHARGQVAHLALGVRPAGQKNVGFERRSPDAGKLNLDPRQILMRLNDALPHDINILAVENAHPRFHARHDARSRTYVYQISRRRDAFGKKYVWWVRDPLDLSAMRAAAAALVGFHNFSSFGDLDDPDQDPRVDLTRLDIRESGDRLLIEISASHFLWKMVRRIVGVLVETGRGRMSPEQVKDFLRQPSREPARLTAPPSGLFLERIEY
ncbi:MAG: tRNA pseudouridine(38-40) synthase TruA [Saprospiraceae bacterium]|nr:tRNA pseudouridine(38-40) synthase TruA [Saprospiraceae bacterium]